jgi:hypothetical protein
MVRPTCPVNGEGIGKMQAGIARTGRTILALFVAAAMVLSVMFLLAEPAEAEHEPPDDIVEQETGSNDAPYWENYLEGIGVEDASCEKLDIAADEAFVMPAEPAGEDWAAVIVKQATTNFVYLNPDAGHSYPSTDAQGPGYSHIIVCSVEEPEEEETTTTEAEETTTTEAEETTTTEAEETTTTQAEETTTTVEILDSTVTTEDTTTTTVEILDSTLTTEASTTSSIEDEVLGTEVLPFTGVDNDLLALLAGSLAMLGSLVLIASRRVED